MNEYTTTLHIRCPFAPVWDYYELTVRSLNMVRCEHIETVCDNHRGKEITQERLADELIDGLGLNRIELTVTGRHGANCLTVCRRES